MEVKVLGFSFTRALKSYGWAVAILTALVVNAAMMTVLYTRDLRHSVGVPAPVSVKQVPATGDRGFDVESFVCSDPSTKVTKDKFAPPDSTFSASYNLDRVKGGVHEVVTVGVYADSDRQPVATHYDSANTPSDAFVSPKALECIKKAVGQ